ncbi:oxygen-dependent protoporphyrinogen oxidase [Cladophialophora chaetospira]|uniref:Protoporphyrinogen oxidase n=1 Tax=Cladophialophora chaetospira TaxID=386627 RepID=A0AA39CMY5_9EURO|nr:oxygen-dependent protoporphyrinogen oxidase [Cladophialophora chaetospira]
MRVAGRNVLLRNLLKSTSQPREQRIVPLRTFKTTTTNGYDDLPSDSITAHVDPVLPAPNPHAREIAILGGGLTGLSTAYHLSRQLPKAKITIYEKSNKLGGWVGSEMVQVHDGEVLFEWGPRTIRGGMGPAPATMVDLVCDLGLTDDLIAIPKDAPAARNRYIYYPDHLVKMPTPFKGSSLSEVFESVRTVATHPLFKGLRSFTKEPWVPIRDEGVKDESLGHFISRRFGKENADNLLSAVYHGIYAGDIYKLSARTLQPLLWHLETRDRREEEGVLFELLSNLLNRRSMTPYKVQRFVDRKKISMLTREEFMPRVPNAQVFKELSVYTFKHGLAQLTSYLEQHVRMNKNITIKTSSPVDSVNFMEDKTQLQLVAKPSRSTAPSRYDYVVSSLSPQLMNQFFQAKSGRDVAGDVDQKLATACAHSSASVNVMVINLYYNNPDLLSIRGFGYLIPRSVPIEQNPERALGVLFSSETSGKYHALHHSTAAPFYYSARWDKEKGTPVVLDEVEPYHGPDYIKQDSANGTKLTVMMGGHWWSDWADGDLPTEQQAIEMAQTLLKRHLNIEERPAVAKARLNRDCIPQYPVGYPQDMATIHDALISGYQGRLKVVGPWWQGSPGMNDCVLSAQEMAWAIRDQRDQYTGLQDYMKEGWVVSDIPTKQSKIEYTK